MLHLESWNFEVKMFPELICIKHLINHWKMDMEVLLLNSSTRRHSLLFKIIHSTVQFSSVARSCLTLCDPMNHSVPGLPVHHQLPEFTQTRIHRVSDTIQPSHPPSSPSPPAPNPSQHQSLFQWVNSSHEVAKVLEFQPQHQAFQWTHRTVSFMDWLDILAVQGTLKSLL